MFGRLMSDEIKTMDCSDRFPIDYTIIYIYIDYMIQVCAL